MRSHYAELHCHSNYSFQEGASSLNELLVRAKELGYPALALTDHDNMCASMEFSRIANSLEVQPITGVEVTLKDGSHLTLLAENRIGYSNLCNLVTLSRTKPDRFNPKLEPKFLSEHAEGLILLTGCSKGRVAQDVTARRSEAKTELTKYIDWFGHGSVFVELQQNLVQGDTYRNRELVRLARCLGIEVVATNNVHYHVPGRHKLQDTLVAIQHNKSLEKTHRERRPNAHFYLKSASEMDVLFKTVPEAVSNTLIIAERCTFNLLENLGYQFPDYPLPNSETPQEHLRKICYEAARRKYTTISKKVRDRLEEELGLIKLHGIAGFFLIYYEVIQIAREAMIDLDLGDPRIPLEENPPGRGRGSSVSMLIGYLIGLSHIDPLQYDLSLGRFIHKEIGTVPDIDLDFPRNIREELIKRVHARWGWDHAALTGMIGTYRMKSCIRDLGKALNVSVENLDKLYSQVDVRNPDTLRSKMVPLPDSRNEVNGPVWRILTDLAKQLEGFPKYLAQHPSGMIISSSPLIDMVPVQPSAMNGRYICHWDRDSVTDAGFLKIDFLSLGTLSQMQEALTLIGKRTGKRIDLSRIDFNNKKVYQDIHSADTVGIFQIESAAQMQTVVRLKPKNLKEMAYEIAAIRPGVGINDGVTQFIERYTKGIKWDYDHPREKAALGRTLGIILFQDQVNELAIGVAGLGPKEADDLRRVFSRKNNEGLIGEYWQRFKTGAAKNGVSEVHAKKIFDKFSGQYMFPESHAYAFGVTAYQMAWLKHYYPLEFYTAIFNQQPMGFYNLETIKEDAKRHGICVLNPDINESLDVCSIKTQNSFRMGLQHVKGLGEISAGAIIKTRERDGRFLSLADAMQRIKLQRTAVENLVTAGAFDSLTSNRRTALWEVGLRYQPPNSQLSLKMPVEQDSAELSIMTNREIMLREYHTMGVFPNGHFMEQVRPNLPSHVLSSHEIPRLGNGTQVTVAGLVIRRQRPHTRAVFITLEDEFGHTSLVVWPDVFQRYRLVINEPVLKIRGTVSKRNGTLNIVVQDVESIDTAFASPKTKDWS